MSNKIPPSELILNEDGSIYHLALLPEDLGDYIITVGDPGRVPMVSKYFDEVEVKKSKREFVTHVGRVGQTRITVLSTGIGPDNIDIVLNELDALVNIDLESRTIKEDLTSLHILRLGTSGCLQPDIMVDSLLFSGFGLGFDNLLHFYHERCNLAEATLRADLALFLHEHEIELPNDPYPAQGSQEMLEKLSHGDPSGITITAPGFYGPQSRRLRLAPLIAAEDLATLSHFKSQGFRMTNFEMETSAIYGLSRLLGHHALSCNVVLANRSNNTFSSNPRAAVDRMIQTMLDRLAS
ncbi:MAG: nucleoside phosphorylase [Lewinella sp.]|nr:nucleoside phosphorylase [Lewinella sp.]